MQLAVVDAAMVAASGGTSTCVEATRAVVEGGVQTGDAENEDYDHTAKMQQSHLPVEHSTGKGLELASTSRSISVTTAIMNTSHSVSSFEPRLLLGTGDMFLLTSCRLVCALRTL